MAASMRSLIIFIAVALSLTTPAAATAENRIVQPDVAVEVLSYGEWVTGNLPAGNLTGNANRVTHCYVFAIEPGSIATVNLRSTAFDAKLVVLAGTVSRTRARGALRR